MFRPNRNWSNKSNKMRNKFLENCIVQLFELQRSVQCKVFWHGFNERGPDFSSWTNKPFVPPNQNFLLCSFQKEKTWRGSQILVLYLGTNTISMRAAIFLCTPSQSNTMYQSRFLLFNFIVYKRKEMIIIRITNYYYFWFIQNHYPRLLQVFNLYCVVTKPTVRLLLTKTRLYSGIQGACTITTALMKPPENNFQLSRLLEF